jgi:hypothetical protein
MCHYAIFAHNFNRALARKESKFKKSRMVKNMKASFFDSFFKKYFLIVLMFTYNAVFLF